MRANRVVHLQPADFPSRFRSVLPRCRDGSCREEHREGLLPDTSKYRRRAPPVHDNGWRAQSHQYLGCLGDYLPVPPAMIVIVFCMKEDQLHIIVHHTQPDVGWWKWKFRSLAPRFSKQMHTSTWCISAPTMRTSLVPSPLTTMNWVLVLRSCTYGDDAISLVSHSQETACIYLTHICSHHCPLHRRAGFHDWAGIGVKNGGLRVTLHYSHTSTSTIFTLTTRYYDFVRAYPIAMQSSVSSLAALLELC
jgi:hypothetical protein